MRIRGLPFGGLGVPKLPSTPRVSAILLFTLMTGSYATDSYVVQTTGKESTKKEKISGVRYEVGGKDHGRDISPATNTAVGIEG